MSTHSPATSQNVELVGNWEGSELVMLCRVKLEAQLEQGDGAEDSQTEPDTESSNHDTAVGVVAHQSRYSGCSRWGGSGKYS